MVVNLEASIAVTQNFVSPTNLPEVLYFLKHRPSQISGFSVCDGNKDVHKNGYNEDEDESGGEGVFGNFVAALQEQYPGVSIEGLRGLARLEMPLDKPESPIALDKGTMWSSLTMSSKSDSTAFSFAFSDFSD